MRSPYRRPGTSFQPGLSSNVHPSPLILVPLVLAGARTTTALQSGFIRAPLLASKTPQLSVMRMPDRRYRRFPTAGGFAGRTVVHVSEGEGEHRPVDEFAAIEAIVTWEEFATSIAEAQKLALYSSAASEKSETAASSSSATAQAASLSSQPPSRSGTRYTSRGRSNPQLGTGRSSTLSCSNSSPHSAGSTSTSPATTNGRVPG